MLNSFSQWGWATINWLQTYNGAVTATATIVIGLFTIALVFVTRRQAQLTNDAVRLGRDEFEAGHRPWLAVRNLRISGPVYVTNDVCIPVQINLENTGSAPAPGFMVYLNGIPFNAASASGIKRVLEEQGVRFARERNTPLLPDTLPFGVVFPKDRLRHPETVSVDIDGLRGEGHRREAISLTILIVGTLFYTSPHDGRDRRTTFTYKTRLLEMTHRVRPIEPGGDYEDIPPHKIEVTRLHLGWTAT